LTVYLLVGLGLDVALIGKSGGESIVINDIKMPLDEAKSIYFGKFVEVIEQDI